MSTENTDSDVQAPKIEFPCLYPIKVIGVASPSFQSQAIAAVERHTGQIDAELIEVNPSKANNYVSIRLTIAATGKEQLERIFEDLKTLPETKMVL